MPTYLLRSLWAAKAYNPLFVYGDSGLQYAAQRQQADRHLQRIRADRKIRSLMAERRSIYNQVTELTNRIKQSDLASKRLVTLVECC